MSNLTQLENAHNQRLFDKYSKELEEIEAEDLQRETEDYSGEPNCFYFAGGDCIAMNGRTISENYCDRCPSRRLR